MKTLLIILVVLSVIALIPVGVDGGYNSKGLSLYLRIGIINISDTTGLLCIRRHKSKAKDEKAKAPKSRFDGKA